MKQGFSIIELILAIALASIVTMILFNSFYQAIRSSVSVQNVIDFETEITIMQNQLEKDLMGVFVPLSEKMKEENTDKPVNQTEKKETLTSAKKDDAKKKPIKDIFLSTNKNGYLSELTFITNNPIRIYEKAENAFVNPRFVRVVYTVVPVKDQENTYALYRQENQELDYKKYGANQTKPIEKYLLSDSIKNITVRYLAPKKEKKKEKNKALELQSFSEWKPLSNEEKDRWILPYFVQFTITIQNQERDQEQTYTLGYSLPGFNDQIERPKKNEQKDELQTKKPVTGPGGVKVQSLQSSNSGLSNTIQTLMKLRHKQ